MDKLPFLEAFFSIASTQRHFAGPGNPIYTRGSILEFRSQPWARERFIDYFSSRVCRFLAFTSSTNFDSSGISNDFTGSSAWLSSNGSLLNSAIISNCRRSVAALIFAAYFDPTIVPQCDGAIRLSCSPAFSSKGRRCQ
jgi:hypothetical protein